jgi:hypothetical protein
LLLSRAFSRAIRRTNFVARFFQRLLAVGVIRQQKNDIDNIFRKISSASWARALSLRRNKFYQMYLNQELNLIIGPA